MPIVTHLLIASRELGILHHNVRLKAIPDVDMAFLFARFAWSIFTLLTGFLRVGVERRLIGTTMSTQYGPPHILSAAECKGLVLGGSKSRSRSPTKRQRRRSYAGIDAEIRGEAHDRSLHYKRRKRVDSVGGAAHDDSKSTESSKAIPTLTCTKGIDSLRDTWLRKERLRSDPDNKWSEEETWATYIRDGDKVMDPADSS
jgi:hypothetical protein